jgi:hypothetical protein
MFSARMLKAHPGAVLVPLLGLFLLARALPASADDRDLLRTSASKPYVFIILDTSGSMNWTPPCTQSQFDAGQCKTLCPYRDCFARLQADDQDSKTYVAKDALYQVLQSVNDVQFGFATYNEDDLWVRGKHWIYKAGANGVTIPGGTVSGVTYPSKIFPAAGADEVVGYLWSCNTGSGNNQTGCAYATPSDLDDTWEVARMQRLPKGGASFNQVVSFFIRWANVIYKVTYTPTGTGPSAAATTIQMKVRVDKCPNSSCNTSGSTLVAEPTITYTQSTTNGKPDEFLSWDNGGTTLNQTITSANPTVDYFDQTTANDSNINVSNTCGVNVTGWGWVGWDSNNDTTADTHSSTYNLRWTTDTTDARGAAYYMGDVIPFDWKTDHKLDIIKRLAPNLATNAAATPDFRISTYFNDLPSGSDSFLRLKDPNARPLIPNGSTPIGNSMNAFKSWYSTGCPTCSPKVTSWKSTAAAQDPEWGCRRKFVLFITDGDETCQASGNIDPCTVVSSLRSSDGVLTYVVGLGLASNTGNKLTCMATNGGTGAPIYPQNKQELIDALTVIFGQIKEAASSFASAAVPTVQTEAADKIYISNFTPLNANSIWNGHVDAYLKPLPLNSSGLPNRNVPCPLVGTAANPRSACHLWDAAAQLLLQAPTPAALAAAGTNVDANAMQLGLTFGTQRRLFYAKAASGSGIPRNLRLYYPPAGTPGTTSTDDWQDLFAGFFPTFPNPVTPTAAAQLLALRVTNIMKETVVQKSDFIDNGSGTPVPITFVLGDTFHADPTIVDKPNDVGRYLANLYGNTQPCADDAATGLPKNPGYKCFADKEQFRRKMLAIAADDGQLHFFDAGIYHTGTLKFDDGTGTELFSYIPRLALPILRDEAERSVHIFGVDSTPRVQDVFIDTNHNGTPTPADRQWRTLAIGGFREGGKPMGGTWSSDFTSGYYALDITQPDTVDPTTHVPSTAPTPNCLTLGNTASSVPANCGTVPFPALLWEFTDSLLGSRLDEDGNGAADLGQTWGIPTVGRIQLKNSSNVVEDRWVAIFGGGMDGANKATPKSGSYVYILDIETGVVLYKQKLTGMITADPAVIDKNNDGIMDTIYMATTAGFVYKIDMSKPVQLQPVTLATSKGLPAFATAQTVQRITDASWIPFAIFDTGGKPIYYGVNVLFVSGIAGGFNYILTFGTGDREDLWNVTGQEGRFYVVVDQGFTSAQNESNYTQVTPSGQAAAGTADLISATLPPTGKNRGWYLRLATDERVITKAFGLSGLIVFSTYQPQTTFTTTSGGPVCGKTGASFAYTIYTKTGNPIIAPQEQDVFLAPPTIDSGSTKNPNNPNQTTAEALTTQQLQIMRSLLQYCPKGTKAGNFFYTVNQSGSDTRYVGIAAIPICLVKRNWNVQ